MGYQALSPDLTFDCGFDAIKYELIDMLNGVILGRIIEPGDGFYITARHTMSYGEASSMAYEVAEEYQMSGWEVNYTYGEFSALKRFFTRKSGWIRFDFTKPLSSPLSLVEDQP